MQLYTCRISLVVTAGEVGNLLTPLLFLWLEGNFSKKACITVVSSTIPNHIVPESITTKTSIEVPFESLFPLVEALYAANFPCPKLEHGVDTSDCAQYAVLTVSLFSAERKGEDALIQMGGMAGSYKGKDAAAMQRAMTILLTLAQLTPSHPSWNFLAEWRRE
jgi:hypothetical protein